MCARGMPSGTWQAVRSSWAASAACTIGPTAGCEEADLRSAGWQNLASDQLLPTPEIFLRTMFSQLNGVKKSKCFLRSRRPSADPSQQVTPSSATRAARRRPVYYTTKHTKGSGLNSKHILDYSPGEPPRRRERNRKHTDASIRLGGGHLPQSALHSSGRRASTM